MDSKGRWKDNVFIERFWRTLKYEEVYLKAYTDLGDARTHLSAYIHYYNAQRTHLSLDHPRCRVYSNPEHLRLSHHLPNLAKLHACVLFIIHLRNLGLLSKRWGPPHLTLVAGIYNYELALS
jgi:hypothetical protein